MKNQNNSIADKPSKFSAANYLERMKEKDEEDKRIRQLSEAQNKREKGGHFVAVVSDSSLFVPAGTEIFVKPGQDEKAVISKFKNRLLERQNRW